VFDLTRSDTFNRLNFWKNEFVHQANIENPETFPFVYIGNKSDLESTRQVTYQMGFEFCDRERGIAYYETSAKACATP
jgi:Ras-related protein Rab-7A